MEKYRETALCCGANPWVYCSAVNHQIQGARLAQAKATGADILFTGCPKCQIHFRCAMRDEKVDEEARIEVEDLVVLAANAF